MFANTPLARRQWTGLGDEHLASIGFVNFAWNALERKFASLVWVTGGWSQEVGELVVAGMGNVSLVLLFTNLLKHELKMRDDRRLWEQGFETGVLFDAIRDARNDVVHAFFDCDPTTGEEGYFKGSPRKCTSGQAELRMVAMATSDIDELCCAVSDCFELIDDLDFENLVPAPHSARKSPGPARSYEQAVHGWQDPPFDVGRLKAYAKKRLRARSHQNGRPAQDRLPVAAPDDQMASVVADAISASLAKEAAGGATLPLPLSNELN